MFGQSISGILMILGLIAVGYYLGWRRWVDDSGLSMISRLVTQLALPAYMLTTITGRFERRQLLGLLPDLGLPVLSMLIMLALAMAVAHLGAIRSSRRGLFISMFFNSNTVFVGLPINQALFGDASIPYVLIYYMCNTTFFWTLGVYLIQRDGGGEGSTLVERVKSLFSPPLLGFILGVILVLAGIHLPSVLEQDLTYLGNLTIPLSMLFIGVTIQRSNRSGFRMERDQFLILLGRFVLAPVVMMLLLSVVSVPSLMKQVFIAQAAMPVMTNAPVVARRYGADSDYAAIMVTETTLATLVVIPILMMII